MSILQKLFGLSLKQDLKTRVIFWGIVVAINASIGFILAHEDYSIIGMILGILCWSLLYSIFWSRFYYKTGELGYKNLQIAFFSGYMLKTMYAFFGILIVLIIAADGRIFWEDYEYTSMFFSMLDFYIWILSAVFVETIWLKWFLTSIDSSWTDAIWTFIMTIVHWWILSIFTLILSVFLYPIIRLSSKYYSSK